MADNKQVGSPVDSSADFLNELFGTTKQHPAIESFLEILSQNNSASTAVTSYIPTYSSGSPVWNPEQEYVPKDSKKANKKEKESVFQEISEHPLCSSIYYGSQEDIPASYFTLCKDEKKSSFKEKSSKDVDSTIDWWKGSFYY